MKIPNYIKSSKIAKYYKQSCGNIFYPLTSLRWWLANLLVPRRFVYYNEIKFTLTCTNWITYFRWYLFKIKEPDTIYFLDKYLEEGSVFFDIGANVGVFTIYAAKKHKNLKIYSFEPEVSNLAILKENIIENNIKDIATIYGVGISNQVGLSKLNLQDLTGGSAMHTEDIKDRNVTEVGNLPIKWAEGIFTVTLDYFCDKLNLIPNVVKIDTDGNEPKILMGATKILKNKNLKAIIIEVPQKQNKYCNDILIGSGFKKEIHKFKESENEIWIRV